MLYQAKIISYEDGKLVVAPLSSIDRALIQKQVGDIEIRLVDGREITADQRKKIFATISDISEWSGHEPKELRAILTWDFCGLAEIEPFSLSNVDRSTARDFIDYLIEFCFSNAVPTRDTMLNRCDDIGRYLYMCLEHRKCAICNDHADVHHVDRVGMGRNRDEICHIGMRAIALCRKHHGEADLYEKEMFAKYHIYGIKLDKYLCDILNLNTKDRR